MFIFLCLWNGVERGSINWRLEGLIKDIGKFYIYINYVLILMVKVLKDYLVLVGWDIINEMEGVFNLNLYSGEFCFDIMFLVFFGVGWKGYIYLV